VSAANVFQEMQLELQNNFSFCVNSSTSAVLLINFARIINDNFFLFYAFLDMGLFISLKCLSIYSVFSSS